MVVGVGQLITLDSNVKDRLENKSVDNVMVEISDYPLGSGGVRVAYHCSIQGRQKRYVAKRYCHQEGFLDDWIVAQIACDTVKAFNKCKPPKKVRMLLPDMILMFKGVKYSLEEFLPGDWQKHNTIFGHLLTNRRTPDAFSHFSYQHSCGAHMILDMQGVGDTFTDPAVVSLRRSRFGYTDTGLQGIRDFFNNHKCGELCRSLGLVAVSIPPHMTEDQADRLVQQNMVAIKQQQQQQQQQPQHQQQQQHQKVHIKQPKKPTQQVILVQKAATQKLATPTLLQVNTQPLSSRGKTNTMALVQQVKQAHPDAVSGSTPLDKQGALLSWRSPSSAKTHVTTTQGKVIQKTTTQGVAHSSPRSAPIISNAEVQQNCILPHTTAHTNQRILSTHPPAGQVYQNIIYSTSGSSTGSNSGSHEGKVAQNYNNIANILLKEKVQQQQHAAIIASNTTSVTDKNINVNGHPSPAINGVLISPKGITTKAAVPTGGTTKPPKAVTSGGHSSTPTLTVNTSQVNANGNNYNIQPQNTSPPLMSPHGITNWVLSPHMTTSTPNANVTSPVSTFNATPYATTNTTPTSSSSTPGGGGGGGAGVTSSSVDMPQPPSGITVKQAVLDVQSPTSKQTTMDDTYSPKTGSDTADPDPIAITVTTEQYITTNDRGEEVQGKGQKTFSRYKDIGEIEVTRTEQQRVLGKPQPENNTRRSSTKPVTKSIGSSRQGSSQGSTSGSRSGTPMLSTAQSTPAAQTSNCNTSLPPSMFNNTNRQKNLVVTSSRSKSNPRISGGSNYSRTKAKVVSHRRGSTPSSVSPIPLIGERSSAAHQRSASVSFKRERESYGGRYHTHSVPRRQSRSLGASLNSSPKAALKANNSSNLTLPNPSPKKIVSAPTSPTASGLGTSETASIVGTENTSCTAVSGAVVCNAAQSLLLADTVVSNKLCHQSDKQVDLSTISADGRLPKQDTTTHTGADSSRVVSSSAAQMLESNTTPEVESCASTTVDTLTGSLKTTCSTVNIMSKHDFKAWLENHGYVTEGKTTGELMKQYKNSGVAVSWGCLYCRTINASDQITCSTCSKVRVDVEFTKPERHEPAMKDATSLFNGSLTMAT